MEDMETFNKSKFAQLMLNEVERAESERLAFYEDKTCNAAEIAALQERDEFLSHYPLFADWFWGRKKRYSRKDYRSDVRYELPYFTSEYSEDLDIDLDLTEGGL